MSVKETINNLIANGIIKEVGRVENDTEYAVTSGSIIRYKDEFLIDCISANEERILFINVNLDKEILYSFENPWELYNITVYNKPETLDPLANIKRLLDSQANTIQALVKKVDILEQQVNDAKKFGQSNTVQTLVEKVAILELQADGAKKWFEDIENKLDKVGRSAQVVLEKLEPYLKVIR